MLLTGLIYRVIKKYYLFHLRFIILFIILLSGCNHSSDSGQNEPQYNNIPVYCEFEQLINIGNDPYSSRVTALIPFIENGYISGVTCQSCHIDHHSAWQDLTIENHKDYYTPEANCELCHGEDLSTGAPQVDWISCNGCHHGEEGMADGHAGISCDICHNGEPSGSECSDSGCHGDSGSHATHITDNNKGPDPALTCDICHNTSHYPQFIDSPTLGDTHVCDNCHSPEGSYNGIVSVGDSVGAKSNWESRVYNGNDLQSGKEKWCAGCHDNEPANSRADGSGIMAPPVIGDENVSTNYGTGYGFYTTGHGLSSSEAYPATGSMGAGQGCLDCHDVIKNHFDSISRTYSADGDYSTYAPESETYQNGYRLKNVSTGYSSMYPMHMPRTGNVFPPGFRADWEFALCFDCHDRDKLFNGGDPVTGEGAGTNFAEKSDGDGGGNPAPAVGTYYSLHDIHTWGANGPFGPSTPQYDSDFDGTADSRMSCPACHNVHGSPSPAMIRHGELISTPGTTDKVPSLDFKYIPSGIYPALFESTGGSTRFIGTGPGSVSKNGTCNMCHNDGTTYYRVPTNIPGPKLSDPNPAGDAVNIDISSNITFTLTDNDSGLEWSTFSIQITGSKGYSKIYTDSDSMVSKTGTPASYNVTVNPDDDFGNGEIITIVVNVDNLNVPSYSMMHPSWSFITASGSSSDALILHPSDIALNSGAFEVINGNWSTVLDSNDGDGSYAYKCCSGGGNLFYVDMDDPLGIEGSTINNITIYVYARYLDGPWPGAIPSAGIINIGYKTGSSTIWSGNTTLDNSGSYNLVMSDTYSSDSDGGLLDLSDIINLQISAQRVSGGGPILLRITEVYVSVGYTP